MAFEVTGLPELTKDPRFVGILWGPVGAGKTPLAATAPGRCCFIMFDTDGWKSIAHLDSIKPGHVNLINLAGESDEIVDKFEKLSDIEAALKPILTDPTISTIVFDSITSFMDRCLTRGIVRVGSTPREKPTNLAPGFRGYGARAMLVRQCVMNVHTLCERHNKSFIATAHEKVEYGKDSQGNETIDFITMLLGGETFVQVPKNFSEIWRMELMNDGKTAILTYPHGYYRPCRSRMFRRNVGYKPSSFEWKFDTYSWQGEGIESWMNQWKEAGCQAILLPR
jgi:hypothetical protein